MVQRPLVPSGTGTGVGGHGSGSAIPLPSRCHPGASGAGAPRQSRSPLCRGKWSKNKLPVHLLPVKGWTVVCTVTSGPSVTPPLALLIVPRVPTKLYLEWQQCRGQIPTPRPLTPSRQKSRQSSRGGAQGPVPTQDAKPGQPRMRHRDFTRTTQWICVGREGGSCRNLPLESGLGHTEPFVNICEGPSSVVL